MRFIIIIIILFVLKLQKYTTIQAWYKQLTICDNYLKKKKKWSAYRKKTREKTARQHRCIADNGDLVINLIILIYRSRFIILAQQTPKPCTCSSYQWRIMWKSTSEIGRSGAIQLGLPWLPDTRTWQDVSKKFLASNTRTWLQYCCQISRTVICFARLADKPMVWRYHPRDYDEEARERVEKANLQLVRIVCSQVGQFDSTPVPYAYWLHLS